MSSKMEEDDNSRDFMDNQNNNNHPSNMEQNSSAMSKAQLRKVGFHRLPVIN